MKTKLIPFLLPVLLFCMTAAADTAYQPFVSWLQSMTPDSSNKPKPRSMP